MPDRSADAMIKNGYAVEYKPGPKPEPQAPKGLAAMSKPELLAEAGARGLDVSESNTKAEIREAIEAGE